jgi:hypothetical protein
MFCEIQMGQLLGPNPGQGGIAQRDEKGRIVSPNPHADPGLPPQRVEEFRRYYRWRDELIEAATGHVRTRLER